MKEKELALKLIEYALKSDVDYVYVLEDLEKILKGEKEIFYEEDYFN